ncbi:MAG: nucleotide exchange factor GrpE [Thiomargarita sp.]|nr:nucleotide exchange factor GrpE [Thiomargarita sp.]
MKSDESLNEKAVSPANKTAKKGNDIPDGEIDDVSEEIPLESTQTTEKTELSVKELTRKLVEVQKKADSYWDSLLRKQAENDNLQKRIARDLEKARKYALEKFAIELLAVKDSMEFGIDAATKQGTDLKAIHDGMTLTLKMLTDTMAKFNIVEINPQDEKFNPQMHEAMVTQIKENVEAGTVLHVHQKGYHINDRLLRPARVVVAKSSPIENQG